MSQEEQVNIVINEIQATELKEEAKPVKEEVFVNIHVSDDPAETTAQEPTQASTPAVEAKAETNVEVHAENTPVEVLSNDSTVPFGGSKPSVSTGITSFLSVLQILLALTLVGLISGDLNKGEVESYLTRHTLWFGLLFGVVQTMSGCTLVEESFGFSVSHSGATAGTLQKLGTGLGVLALGFAGQSIHENGHQNNDVHTAIYAIIIINSAYNFWLLHGQMTRYPAKDGGKSDPLAIVQFSFGILLVGLIAGYLAEHYAINNLISNTMVYGLLFGVIQFFSGWFWLDYSRHGRWDLSTVSTLVNLGTGVGFLALGFACKTIDINMIAQPDLGTTIYSFIIINSVLSLAISCVVSMKLVGEASLPDHGPKHLGWVLFASLAIVLFGLESGIFNKSASDEGQDLLKINTNMYTLLFAVVQTLTSFVYAAYKISGKANIDLIVSLFKITVALGFLALGFACKSIDEYWANRTDLDITTSAFTIINAIVSVHMLRAIQHKDSAEKSGNMFAKCLSVLQFGSSLLLLGLLGGYINIQEAALFYTIALAFGVIQAVSGLSMCGQYFPSLNFSAFGNDSVTAVTKVAAALGLLSLGFACKQVDQLLLNDWQNAIAAIIIFNALLSLYLVFLMGRGWLSGPSAIVLDFGSVEAISQLATGVLLVGLLGGLLNRPGVENAFTTDLIWLDNYNYAYGLIFAVVQLASGISMCEDRFKRFGSAGSEHISVVSKSILRAAAAFGLIALAFTCKQIDSVAHPWTSNLHITISAIIIFNSLFTLYLAFKKEHIEEKTIGELPLGITQIVFGTVLFGLVAGYVNTDKFDVQHLIVTENLTARYTVWFTLILAVFQFVSGYTMAFAYGDSREVAAALNRLTHILGWLALGFASKSLNQLGSTTGTLAALLSFTIINCVLSMIVDIVFNLKESTGIKTAHSDSKMSIAQLIFSIILFGLVSSFIQLHNTELTWIQSTTMRYAIIFSVVQFISGCMITEKMLKIEILMKNVGRDAITSVLGVTTVLGFLAFGFVCRSIGLGENSSQHVETIYAFVIINSFLSLKLLSESVAEKAN